MPSDGVDSELSGHVVDDTRGDGSRICNKCPEEAHGRELESEAETIVVTTAFFDECSVGVVEVEAPGELCGRRITPKPSVAAFLFVAQEISGRRALARLDAGENEIG